LTVERTVREDKLTDLSVSRVGVANKCGLAFEYQYVKRLPAVYDTAASIFGNVIHDGVMDWYGGDGPITPQNKNHHHNADLVNIVRAQWPQKLPPKIWEHITALIDLDIERVAVASAIKLKRPHLKNPLQTKEFLESSSAKEYSGALTEMIDLCNRFKEIKWPQDENAFQAYQKSERIAMQIQREWQDQPRPLLVEEPFRLEFGDFVLRGRIDQVRSDPTLEGLLCDPYTLDIKSGKQLLTQMEAFLQTFIYNEATRQMEYDFIPNDLTAMEFYMVRHLGPNGYIKRQAGNIDYRRHARLALKILNGVVNRIKSESFEPHYGMWCKQCDFRDLCEREISLWQGDGLKLEVAA
jgi:RecB family exonuclease